MCSWKTGHWQTSPEGHKGCDFVIIKLKSKQDFEYFCFGISLCVGKGLFFSSSSFLPSSSFLKVLCTEWVDLALAYWYHLLCFILYQTNRKVVDQVAVLLLSCINCPYNNNYVHQIWNSSFVVIYIYINFIISPSRFCLKSGAVGGPSLPLISCQKWSTCQHIESIKSPPESHGYLLTPSCKFEDLEKKILSKLERANKELSQYTKCKGSSDSSTHGDCH